MDRQASESRPGQQPGRSCRWLVPLLGFFVLSGPAGAAEDAAANRLQHETSPYLRLHAHNPVDWYPWGPEAFEKAKEENKPIFLSVGYSSCHWCHVMERESFQSEEIAATKLAEREAAWKAERQELLDSLRDDNQKSLAARLEALTRELDAALVVDATTWEAARDAASGWLRHPEMRVRGRSEALDLYALPLEPSGA